MNTMRNTEPNMTDLIALAATIQNELTDAAQQERVGATGLFARQCKYRADDIKKLPILQDFIMRTAADLDCTADVEAALQTNDTMPVDLGQLRPADFSDAGNAVVFSKVFASQMLYTDTADWYIWDGVRWVADEQYARMNAIQLSEAMLHDAESDFLMSKDNAYLKHAQRTRNKSKLDSMLDLAKAYMAKNPDLLDADPNALNTPGGIYDLETGTRTDCKRTAFCTRTTTVAPSHENAALWTDFVKLITCGDDEYARYLQMVIGCAAFGKILSERMIVATGGGRNGKSTFFNAIAGVLGDDAAGYAGTMNSSMLVAGNTESLTAQYMSELRGKRLILSGELEEGTRLSVATIKRICSTDSIQAKRLYHNPEQFRPSHTVCLFTNFLPRVGSTDNGTWRRLVVLPFDAVMPSGNDEIPDYAHFLIDVCGGAILQWIIDGAKMFAENGYHFPTCAKVEAATRDYQTRENWLNGFIAERCEIGAGYSVGAGQLFDAYRAYAKEQGDYAHRRVEFNATMEMAGFEKRNVGAHKVEWCGVRLLDEYAFRQ